MRFLLIALLAIALQGCWIGFNLYSASDARPAIPPGVYMASARDEPLRVYRVSMLPDGMTQFDTGEKKETYGFAPLERDTYVGWMQVEDEPRAGESKDANQMYGLAVRQADGALFIYAPECRDEGAEIARKHGATIESGISLTCQFQTRASLEAAMRPLPRDNRSALKLVRIRN